MTAQLFAARDAVVREHMESENRHDFEATLATFDHPRYELVGTGDIHDGEEAVRRYYAETRAAFPDQRNRITALHRADDAIIVEFVLQGTHDGPFRGLPPTGRPFSCPMMPSSSSPPAATASPASASSSTPAPSSASSASPTTPSPSAAASPPPSTTP